MSDGLAELLGKGPRTVRRSLIEKNVLKINQGDAARPLDDQTPCSRSVPSTSATSISDFQKYSQEESGVNTHPAIKLTFRDPVNISQLKVIQVFTFESKFRTLSSHDFRTLCENMDDYMEIVK